MIMDIIVRASSKSALVTWANDLNLRIDDGDGGKRNHPGIRWTWWSGDGKLMTAKGTYDRDGSEITPPTYASGVVAIIRITGDFSFGGEADQLTPDDTDPDKDEQWARSRVARFIKNNGTQDTSDGISYWELNGVRLYEPADVAAFLVTNDVPGHTWQGGNNH